MLRVIHLVHSNSLDGTDTQMRFHKGLIDTNNVPVADLLCVVLKRMKRSYVKFSRKAGKDPYLGKKRRRERRKKTKKMEGGLEDENHLYCLKMLVQ